MTQESLLVQAAEGRKRVRYVATLADCIALTRVSPEFVENWARLRGMRLPNSPIERMIDQAAGYAAEVEALFVADVAEMFLGRLGGQGE